MKAETRMMQPQAEECLESTETLEAEPGKEGTSPGDFGGNIALQHLEFGLLVSRAARK